MDNSALPQALPPTPANLREALRFWTTGVTIVAASFEGVTHGMTVNSFNSLSLDPPLVSISLEKITRTHQLVQQAGAFAVTMLTEQQAEISNRFAGRDSEHSQRFKGLDTFTLETGNPMLSEGLAFFDCRVTACHDAGTHNVFIADVVACGTYSNGDHSPLVYFNRGYRELKLD